MHRHCTHVSSAVALSHHGHQPYTDGLLLTAPRATSSGFAFSASRSSFIAFVNGLVVLGRAYMVDRQRR